MKDNFLIVYANPCSSALSDPDIQTFEDTKRHPVVEWPYAADLAKCSPPRFGCVRVEGGHAWPGRPSTATLRRARTACCSSATPLTSEERNRPW